MTSSNGGRRFAFPPYASCVFLRVENDMCEHGTFTFAYEAVSFADISALSNA